MKKTASLTHLAESIRLFAKDTGGVFGFSDLWNLIGLHSSDRTAKVVNRLVREGILFKIRRGIYATDKPDLWVLGCRLREKACISMDSVLAKEGLVGTVPALSVSLIDPGKAQTVETPFGRLRYFKIKKDLLFGCVGVQKGMRVADKEKAFLDLLYYHAKGARFAIDPLKDIDLWKLDRAKIRKYLNAYKNPKFRCFVEGTLNVNDA